MEGRKRRQQGEGTAADMAKDVPLGQKGLLSQTLDFSFFKIMITEDEDGDYDVNILKVWSFLRHKCSHIFYPIIPYVLIVRLS